MLEMIVRVRRALTSIAPETERLPLDAAAEAVAHKYRQLWSKQDRAAFALWKIRLFGIVS